jgi:hypothetical protein
MKSSTRSLIPFLLFLLNHIRLPSPELDPALDITQKTASIVKEACLLIRCLAVDVLMLRTFASAGMCLPSRCLEMGIHVTIFISIFILVLSSHLCLELSCDIAMRYYNKCFVCISCFLDVRYIFLFN